MGLMMILGGICAVLMIFIFYFGFELWNWFFIFFVATVIAAGYGTTDYQYAICTLYFINIVAYKALKKHVVRTVL